MYMVLAIAAGGAIGAVLRYAVYSASLVALGSAFPYGTVIVNIVGSFIMGVLISLFDLYWQPSQELKLFLMTGVLGAFTTFSNFSMDAIMMIEKGEWFYSSLYIVGVVLLSIFSFMVGMMLVRNIIL